MADPSKDLARQACDTALMASVSTMFANLLASFATAKTDADREMALERHRTGLQLSREVHAASLKLIEEVFDEELT
jgi:hypothetical protein